MKINKRRTPELIAGVLLLSIFFVPCAGVHAEDFSEEQKESIKSVVAEAIGESDVVTKTDLDRSVKKAVRDANNSAGSQNSLTKENVGAIVNDVLEKAGIKTSATKKDVSSVKTPAWLAFGVPTGLGLACLALLIVLMVRKPKKTDDESEKAKRNKERDEYFNGLFKSLDDKIQKVQTTIGANKPPAASEISGAVKTDLSNYVKPKFESLDKKIGEIKVPAAGDIARDVSGSVRKDIDSVKSFIQETKGYLEETRKVIGSVNQDFGGAKELLEKIRKDQKEHLEKIETDRKVFEQEKQKAQHELDERRKNLDKEKADLVKRDAKLEQDNAALARKQGDLVAKEKHLDEEKKGLDARIKQAVENARVECRNQFAQEKAALEQKSAQEKAAVEAKCSQEKAALSATIGELQKKVNGHDQEIERYTNQLKTANDEIGKLREDNQALNGEKQNLITEKQNLSSKLDEKDKAISDLNAENKTIWDKAKAKYEPEIQSLQVENESLAKELESEKKRNQEKQDKLEDFERKNKALQDETARLAGVLEAAQRRSEQFETELKQLMTEGEELRKETQRLQTELAAARDSVQKSEKIIYPEEFNSDPKFAVLKQHLDEWKDIPESAIVRASLQLFSQRGTLKKEDTLSLALRDLSFGISQTLSRKNAAPNEVIAELVSWCDFIQGYSDDNFKFSLQIPGLGENYDSTRMTTTRNTDRVHKVLSWMVLIHRRNANPIKKLAEVE